VGAPVATLKGPMPDADVLRLIKQRTRAGRGRWRRLYGPDRWQGDYAIVEGWALVGRGRQLAVTYQNGELVAVHEWTRRGRTPVFTWTRAQILAMKRQVGFEARHAAVYAERRTRDA
jgi:hypothetical protein